jgi:aminoglycoside phosphotransferase family enzyme
MTDCTVKNPCVEKYYKSMTDEQRLEMLYKELEYLEGIRRNIDRDINKILLSKEWISVKDRLPEHMDKVLVVYEDSDNILMASYTDGILGKGFSVYYADGRKPTHTPITHWMPLPEPPKQ